MADFNATFVHTMFSFLIERDTHAHHDRQSDDHTDLNDFRCAAEVLTKWAGTLLAKS